ncbi:hypothetical protein GCM10009678_86370 [Actinomadura kijaniata]|uniref:Uncharacterized protein n=1 Tax=Actinomadura namibiensis TaxID=182080 RepID=A0A7W3M0E6_ACTNM|nr:hypothetical protein [Actinomadura namibiensis]MBA8957709.1 hypothetical protein [Actinomadura namibiensis]
MSADATARPWGARVRHTPEVVRRTRRPAARADGVITCGTGIREYVLTCTCGRTWEPHPSKRMAEMDRHQHLAEVADVPAGERCRQPGRHRTPPSERCALCADQLSFDFTPDLDGDPS